MPSSSAWLFLVLVLNWWMSFRWVEFEAWSIDVFIIIIIVWAAAHYVAAITLYPPLSAGVVSADPDDGMGLRRQALPRVILWDQ